MGGEVGWGGGGLNENNLYRNYFELFFMKSVYFIVIWRIIYSKYYSFFVRLHTNAVTYVTKHII